jgi:D-sedoheptulose 7-phosphate isomerase
MKSMLSQAIKDLSDLLAKLPALEDPLLRLGDVMIACWAKHGKVLIAGNGGSAADAMHFAEELVVRFRKDRRALAAIALTDPTVITCAGNDHGYDTIFARQVEALANPGDVFIAMTTSGKSPNIVRAIQAARAKKVTTAAFLGKDGGDVKGLIDIELLVPSNDTARIQEAHKVLFHTLCEWIDNQVD